MTFTEVGDRAFTRRYEFLDQNIGVILGDGGVLVIDTRSSHRQARQLLDEIATLTALPVRWVVNTHWHWDHTLGNAEFRNAALWGHVEARNELAANGERAREAAKEHMPAEEHGDVDDVEITPPTEVFDDSASIDIGGRTVHLAYLGRGHTGGDVVITLSDDPLLWAGDLLEQGAPPSFGDAYPIAWPSTVDRVIERSTGVIVPGHGDVMGPAAVRTQHGELEAIAAMAVDAWGSGTPLDSIDVGKGPYPADVMCLALHRAYAELG
ncbi:MAG TPA: MBL fold metallo-hydrolase [Acidimicrobiia bacterium]